MEEKENIQSAYSNYKNSFYDFSGEETVNSAEIEAQKEYLAFMEKMKIFTKPRSVSEAKELFKTIFPLKDEYTYLKIGNARCVVISRHDIFRICIDSEKEYVCYNFLPFKNQENNQQ